MGSSTVYCYKRRSISDINTLLLALRFIIVNAILAFIFLFIALEEIDWSIFKFREEINDLVIDNTSWNVNQIF
tara:strand:- start:295 stop:513 length:219 start_codon:yes stop_codon:yes gene_type:complete